MNRSNRIEMHQTKNTTIVQVRLEAFEQSMMDRTIASVHLSNLNLRLWNWKIHNFAMQILYKTRIVDFSLSPKQRLCYTALWSPNRLEKIHSREYCPKSVSRRLSFALPDPSRNWLRTIDQSSTLIELRTIDFIVKSFKVNLEILRTFECIFLFNYYESTGA